MIELDEAKLHLRVIANEEDSLIATYIEAAEDAVAQYLKRPIPWADADGNPVPVPASVRAAALLIVGDLYATREAVTHDRNAHAEVNPTVERLLAPYRALTVS